MAVRKLKPVTPGQRHKIIGAFDTITESTPEKSLLEPIKRTGGRNSAGRMTMRYIGGGHKRKYRVIDFKREKIGMEAKVESIQYDPNRSARIALLVYTDGEKRYILAPAGLNVGDQLLSGEEAEARLGNTLALKMIPDGSIIHNVELKPGKGGQLARSAGASVQLMAKDGAYATIKLGSGEVRLVDSRCRATMGSIGNADHENISIGKAGRNRWKGWRPRVRAVVKNPVDHPMGGGEGRSSGGRHPCSPWGQIAKGLKTRKLSKQSSKLIMSRRKKR